jgi:sn-glycerol 3-phosphate transport system ATP-binding protein/multiple sugar transport system ATP-binding protein
VSGVTLEGVAKSYDGLVALQPLDLSAADGELLVVLGPSGCGKSTLLRLVAGLEQADTGRIAIGGRDVTHEQPGRRNVSMVFQSYALFPHMTVAENIGFGLVARDVPAAVVRERVEEAAGLAGCGELLDRRPPQLSGGERQRVALARALVRRPDVFLLDEPLSNLDAELRAQTRADLKLLHQRVGGTMLYVTHDQAEALTLGDRIAVLRAGELQQLGTPHEVWHAPANAFVARFVGAPGMNLLAAGSPLGLEVPAGLQVGVRPEHVRLGSEGVAAEVILVEQVGGDAIVHLSSGGERFVSRVDAEAAPAPGARVQVSVRQADLHFFDATTGVRRP